MAHTRFYNSGNGFLRKVWPSYRGKRAGKIAKFREATRRQKINVVQSREFNHVKAFSTGLRTHNPANCKYIKPSPIPEAPRSGQETSSKTFVPNILLSNVMSLAPKIDELRYYITYSNLDLVCLTETWLQEHIYNNVVAISDFNLLRRDRKDRQHGGVCIYIRDSIQFSLLDDLSEPSFEVIWVKIRPDRLPRGFSNVIVGTVYHPPSSNNLAMLNYLWNCLSSIESKYSNCGILLLGDFNNLDVSRLKSNFKLKQIVNFPTRAQNTLDLILTNLHEFYDTPVKKPPFGLSDHLSIEVNSKSRTLLPQSKFKVKSRDLRRSNRLALNLYLKKVDIPALINTGTTCSEKVSILESIINIGLDIISPIRTKTIHSNEPPWINPTLKRLIRRRQTSLSWIF